LPSREDMVLSTASSLVLGAFTDELREFLAESMGASRVIVDCWREIGMIVSFESEVRRGLP
jgi:hypothetical protein